MNKRMFVYVGIIAAVLVGIGVMSGIIPPKSGTEGSIGAANRYQSTQIEDKDVALENSEFNDLLQSDVVHKLATDVEFRKMWNSDHFRQLIQDRRFQKAVADKKFAEFMAKGGIDQILAEARATHGTVEGHAGSSVDPNQKNTAPTTLDRKISSDLSKAGHASDAFAKGTATADHAKKVSGNGDLQKRSDLEVLLRNPEFGDMLKSREFLEFAKAHGTEVTSLFRNPNAVQLLGHAGLLRNPDRMGELSRAINHSVDMDKRAK